MNPPDAMSEAGEAQFLCQQCGGAMVSVGTGPMCLTCLADRLLAPPEAGEPVGPTESSRALRRMGDYELQEEIARGGMGVVFRARQLSLGRTVAVKVLRDAWLATEEQVLRFRAEAASAAKLRHPHIVAIHEVGEEEGQHFFAMDLIEGPNLAELAQSRPLPARRAAEIVALIADAVQHAHERGVLHRDLKPSNVLMDAAGHPLVTDFGLARPLNEDSSLTATGQILGTPGFLAPEQARGEAGIGPRADVYGLGAILFHLLTGRPPFVGASAAETLSLVLRQEALSVRLLNPSAPLDLAAVCARCLAKAPSGRYAAARDVADDLRRFLRGVPTVARPASALEILIRWCLREPWLAGAVTFGLVAFLAGVAGTSWQWRAARKAGEAAAEQLWRADAFAARALQRGGEQGQRTESLRLIAKAAAFRTSRELTDDALAALVRFDLEPRAAWLAVEGADAVQVVPPTYAVDPRHGRVAVWNSEPPGVQSIHVTSLEGGGPPQELNHTNRSGSELVFSPDGRWLVARYFYDRGEVVLWDLTTGSRKQVLTSPANTYFSFDFSPDAHWLAVCATNSSVRLFRTDTGEEAPPIVVEKSLRDPVLARFSPGGGQLAVVAGTEVGIWDLKRRVRVQHERFEPSPSGIAWHPAGDRLAITCWFRSEIRLLQVGGDRAIRLLTDDGGPHLLLFFDPRGEVLVARGRDGRTRVWDLVTGRPILRTRTGLASGFSADGSRLYFDREHAGIGVWDVVRPVGYQVFKTGSTSEMLGGPDFTGDGRTLFWGESGGYASADLASGRVKHFPGARVWSVRSERSGGGLLLAGDAGLLRRAASGTTKPLLNASAFRAVDQSTDGASIIGVTPEQAWIGGKSGFTRVPVEGDAFHSIALDPNRRWMVAGPYMSEAKVVELASGRVVHRIPGIRTTAAFAPDGQWLATVSLSRCEVWSVPGWQSLYHWDRLSADSQHSPLAVSPTGSLLATTLTPNTVHLLDPITGGEVARLDGPTSLFISALAFSRDGGQLAVSSQDGVMQVWDLAALRKELGRLRLDWSDSRPRGL